MEIPLDDGGTLVVRPGQDTARDASGARLYHITWAQDADGALSVSFHLPKCSFPTRRSLCRTMEWLYTFVVVTGCYDTQRNCMCFSVAS
jgi:hypothetical protein